MQQVIGRTLLLHFESTELQHCYQRQDVRDWLTLASMKGSSRHLKGQGKWSLRFSFTLCASYSPTPTHVSPALKGVHKAHQGSVIFSSIFQGQRTLEIMTYVNIFVHALFPSSSVGKLAAWSPHVAEVVCCLFFSCASYIIQVILITRGEGNNSRAD